MNQSDIFADALWQFYETGKAKLSTQRRNGHLEREDVSWYFTTFREFPAHEKQALKFARGKILDVGCGAGRHSLYFQRRGLSVVAIDVSARIVQLAQACGVRDARVADINHKLPFTNNQFDTVLLFGNNLGISGTIPRFRKMLRELYRVTSPRGRIIATTRMAGAENPVRKGYLSENSGAIQLRLVLNGQRGKPFNFLLFAPADLLEIARKEKWEMTNVFMLEDFETGYAVVLEKIR